MLPTHACKHRAIENSCTRKTSSDASSCTIHKDGLLKDVCSLSDASASPMSVPCSWGVVLASQMLKHLKRTLSAVSELLKFVDCLMYGADH